jgi:hypothetical protein
MDCGLLVFVKGAEGRMHPLKHRLVTRDIEYRLQWTEVDENKVRPTAVNADRDKGMIYML